ncbi:MAG: glycine cleavage system aminomethyltransferase GcvT, partial [Elusimicrobia bacterium]|nr:glycine cleavage system aminomethyltransferase GcvT [Elusimicrobiota bacterium]
MNKKTPLYNEHLKLKAKITEFGGWDMPLQYVSVASEHASVRENCGMFDVSHMGTFEISGSDSGKFLDKITVGNISGMSEKKAKYSVLLNLQGGIVDDVIVYRFDGKYLMVVNAGNLDKDLAWLNQNKPENVSIENKSSEICLISLQGPKSQAVLQNIVVNDLSQIKYFNCDELEFNNKQAMLPTMLAARTGYTGEDGFEIFVPKQYAGIMWESLLALGV